MQFSSIELEGDGYSETLKLWLEPENLLYQGLVDDFITKEKIDLQLKLNFGEQVTYHFDVKKFAGCILLIPELPIKYAHRVHHFKTILLAQESLESLWKQLHFRIERFSIPSVTHADLMMSWFLTSEMPTPSIYSIEGFYSFFKTEFLAQFPDTMPSVMTVIENYLSTNDVLTESIITEIHEDTNLITLFFDDASRTKEWRAISELLTLLPLNDSYGLLTPTVPSN